MLSVSNLQSGYGKKQILHGITLAVGEGEVVSLMGRNGMGKTTSLRTIMGLTGAWSGRVEFHGQDITHATPETISQRGIGYVPEGRGIFPNLTVYENLIMSARPAAGRLRASTSCFRGSTSARRIGEINSLAASSRCSRSAARFCSTPRLIMLDEATEGLAPLIQDGDLGLPRSHPH